MGHTSTATEQHERLPEAPAERMRDRLLARLRARRFDSALAAGDLADDQRADGRTGSSLRARLQQALDALEPGA